MFERGTDGPKVILVGLDGTDPSMHAAAYAAGLARRQHARLVVVTVLTPPPMASLAPQAAAMLEETLQQMAADLAAQVHEGAERLGLEASYITTRGDAFTEIARIADETLADSVIVGASAQAGHRLVGSIAVRLVRAGRWPVTVVP
jgi:nucleotide-binding universal stress UspA family protein